MVSFADRFTVIRVSTTITEEDSRQGEVAGWSSGMPYCCVSPKPFLALALGPQVFDLLGYFMDSFRHHFIGKPLVVYDFAFVKPVSQHVSHAGSGKRPLPAGPKSTGVEPVRHVAV